MPGGGARFRQALAERVLVLDGAFGTELLARVHADELPALAPGRPLCLERLTGTAPEVVRAVHDDYLAAGCDVLTTNTFGAAPHALAEHGHAGRAEELNRAAAGLATARRDAHGAGHVLGSMGPGRQLPSLGQGSYRELRASYEVQARALLDGGVDGLLVETVQDPLQAKAAIVAALEARAALGSDAALVVSITLDVTGTTLVGTDLEAAVAILDPYPVDLVGLNCAVGPRELEAHVRALAAVCRRPFGVWPNAGLPQVVDGRPHYPLTPAELADWLERFVAEDGAALVGGCCGTTPAHLAAVAAAIGERAPLRRKPAHRPRVASLFAAVDLAPADLALLVGGEGCDVRDLDAGADDPASGAPASTAAPLRLVGTLPELRAACERIGGRSLLFAASLEDGPGPLAEACALAREHGAVLVARSVDEDGPARTAEEKLRVARRLYQHCVEDGGLRPGDVLLDVLAAPIGAGDERDRRAALESLDGARRVREELPGVGLLLHVADVSAGLPDGARRAVDAVFLALAREAGVTAAAPGPHGLADPDALDTASRRACEDALLDRRREGYDPLPLLAEVDAPEGAAAPAPRRARPPAPRARAPRDDEPVRVPSPPFLGARLTEQVELRSLLPYVDEATLFQRHWGNRRRGRSAEAHRRFLEEEVRPLYHALARRCEVEGLLRPRAAHGYWRARRDGDDLVLLDPARPERERARLAFPRAAPPDGRCVADWFEGEDGEPDVVALLAVTLGERPADEIRGRFADGRARDSQELAGLAAEVVHAFLEALHRQVRGELGISRADAREIGSVREGGYRGARLRLGLPPCGGAENLTRAVEVLDAGAIGVAVGPDGALAPEHAAVALVCHRPGAQWFPV